MSLAESSKKLNLERVVFIGRTWNEYISMFHLSEDELQGRKIFDCPGGPSSFSSESRQKGLDVTAADLAYRESPEVLEAKGLEDIAHTMIHMERTKGNYSWDFFKTVKDLEDHRRRALADFIKDMRNARGRYASAILPNLPFQDHAFDMTLSSHFLFMYADRLSYDFHLKTILELLRVTKDELRIFPLVDLSGHRYPYLHQIIAKIRDEGWETKEIRVPYEFQRNANTMLKFYK